MAGLESRVAALEHKRGPAMRSLSDAELEERLACLMAIAAGRPVTDDELPAMLASIKEQPLDA